jgi:two-component system response regulator YesN
MGKKGFKIVGEAESGKEALDIMRRWEPDVVLTDISMPDMNGIELAKAIHDSYPDCYMVIVTGYREFEYARAAVKIGVEDFLLKPVNMGDIEKATDAILDKMNKRRCNREEVQKLKNQVIEGNRFPNYGTTESLDKIKHINPTVQSALAYIDKNYCNPELTLHRVADEIFANESYLSRVFKKELDENLIEYVTRKRIEKSIRLLDTTNLRAYEIAEKTGFRDPHYFSICFKKQVGITVKEFKNRDSKKIEL